MSDVAQRCNNTLKFFSKFTQVLKWAVVCVLEHWRNGPHLCAQNCSDRDVSVGWNNRPWGSRGFDPYTAPEEGCCSTPGLKMSDVSP